MMNKTKAQRAATVNKIIELIASTDRKFFNHNGSIAHMYVKHNRVYMYNEYNNSQMRMCKDKKGVTYKPKGWHHGGTLFGLTKDFTDFIHNGGETNHNNGYGGLYCPHWGYSKLGMMEIVKLAKELGYLK